MGGGGGVVGEGRGGEEEEGSDSISSISFVVVRGSKAISKLGRKRELLQKESLSV